MTIDHERYKWALVSPGWLGSSTKLTHLLKSSRYPISLTQLPRGDPSPLFSGDPERAQEWALASMCLGYRCRPPPVHSTDTINTDQCLPADLSDISKMTNGGREGASFHITSHRSSRQVINLLPMIVSYQQSRQATTNAFPVNTSVKHFCIFQVVWSVSWCRLLDEVSLGASIAITKH